LKNFENFKKIEKNINYFEEFVVILNFQQFDFKISKLNEEEEELNLKKIIIHVMKKKLIKIRSKIHETLENEQKIIQNLENFIDFFFKS